jgi:Amt family ammonium transporter
MKCKSKIDGFFSRVIIFEGRRRGQGLGAVTFFGLPQERERKKTMGGLNGADTAWVLLSAALVMLMTPALGLFYAGLVRKKNVVSTLMHSLFMVALISVQWVVVGYTLAFGPDVGGVIGNFKWLMLGGVNQEPNPTYSTSIPHLAFMAYQMMFAIITPALISGAFAERKRFGAFVIFSLLWATLVYDPIAHWVWAEGGWLRKLGALDFAGGTVVHVTSGVAALVCALVLGKRMGYGEEPMEPHNTTLTILGTALLWFGWFGFNAGSALGSGGLAATAFVTTNTAAAMAALTWTAASWIRHQRPTSLGFTAGAVAGLVAITPAAGFVTPAAALAIGFIAGLICFFAVEVVTKKRVDDALDVFGVHGVGGAVGAILTGVFATTAVNPAGANGLLAGNPQQLVIQLVAVGITVAYTVVVTWGLLKLVDVFVGLRVTPEEEVAGLDVSQHGERAYTLS